MRLWTIILIFVLSQIASGQNVHIDSCGLHSDKKLNRNESIYFNKAFSSQRGTFDFTSKNISFFFGIYGKKVINKRIYFKNWGKDFYKRGIEDSISQLIILNHHEKILSNGVDAIVVTLSTFKLEDKHRHDLIKRTGNLGKCKNFGIEQIWGQMRLSTCYEHTFFSHPNFLINSNVGIGFTDRTHTKDVTFGVHCGVIILMGYKFLYVEAGLTPTTYIDKHAGFINLNGWTGLRVILRSVGFISLGYTPRMYSTYHSTDPIFNYDIGMKMGFNLRNR